MPDLFPDHPGRLFALAAVLPLIPVAGLLLAATVRNLARPAARSGGWPATVYWLLGGDHPLTVGGYAALAAMVAAAVLAGSGLAQYLDDAEALRGDPARMEARWGEQADWVRVGAAKGGRPATAFRLGYRIDQLSAVMVTMVTVVGSLIFLFSIGYLRDEAKERVEDHVVDPPDPGQDLPSRHEVTGHHDDGHPGAAGGRWPAPGRHEVTGHHDDGHAAVFTRRGRFGRFFLYLSLFAFSMLTLLIADNLLQVFVGWELVGVCSFFLVGFYTERPAACAAANKAFLVNRVGDAGFLVGIAIAWTTFGTLDIHDLAVALDGVRPVGFTDAVWVVMGLGIFLGCVGKSAQVPLHTWLPDAMEGPTPVSALIHAATMVAAGVYLVGRCYPLFAPDVLLVVAYTGAVTLFLAATIACVQTDIKRVLAYSTVSQLGFMMLALGVGGWAAGLFHLLTHACFKALLFLAAGSVIFGLHHEQDLRRMGGLRRKLPVTAYAMLVGVLAICGFPLTSGWASKDVVLSAALGYGLANERHLLLFVLPLVTAGLTAFYMVRLWCLAFAGEPRDAHVYGHAHESPWVMTLPLVVLAGFSVVAGWGSPVWSPEASRLVHVLQAGEPAARADFGAARDLAEHYHLAAGGLALLAAVVGAGVAVRLFGVRKPSVADLTPAQTGLIGFLVHKWYFDDLYSAVFLRPIVRLGFLSAAADKRPTDGPGPARALDPGTLDGLGNAVAELIARAGAVLRRSQTGFIRGYVLALALTVTGLLGMLAVLTR